MIIWWWNIFSIFGITLFMSSPLSFLFTMIARWLLANQIKCGKHIQWALFKNACKLLATCQKPLKTKRQIYILPISVEVWFWRVNIALWRNTFDVVLCKLEPVYTSLNHFGHVWKPKSENVITNVAFSSIGNKQNSTSTDWS